MIDWDRALELREEMGEDGFDEVIELFLTEVEEALDRLGDDAGNPAAMESALHFLKGAALNLGFKGFAALCAKGESEASAGDVSAIETDGVRALYHASKTDFLTGLHARVA
ncbi:Hpt domain-containing protein [Aestuariicoccus sp. MJ-SS9]|uniref:Hpt domain-containing protein n=1 Tax=Aestuariicoccus sp. MJ-SS9 TaxID=3079855 RepID=UPI00290BA25A|nr:Hpt domain-containing protein [Aestuariicoccus sp. MJ-SS9]MDU8910888.1 Hpt domain-containing protein [Aestuariicoccus sp. MJ-SS9]